MTGSSNKNRRTERLQTARTKVRRRAERGAYDRKIVNEILDEALYCHIGFILDGQPFVIPTIHARVGDQLYLHGAVAGRMLQTLAKGVQLCVTVTLLDGLVLARSAFHHSMNYRSAVILGSAVEVTSQEEKLAAMQAIVEHVVQGRWLDIRRPTEKELKATSVLSIAILEASAKIRRGPPIDDEQDYALPCWAGEVPLRSGADAPIPDSRLPPHIPIPPYLIRLRR